MRGRGINGLAAHTGRVPSDEFVHLLYGVGLVTAQGFFRTPSIVITLDLYGSAVEGLMD